VKLAAVVIAFLAAAAAAEAGVTIATSPGAVLLRVDARGQAEVDWTAAGTRRTILVRPGAEVLPGGRISGRDVSRPATAAIPFRRVVRAAPGGWRWALQAWRVLPGGPLELRVDRWRGGEPQLTLMVDNGSRLIGRATFHGRPVAQTSLSFEGKRMRTYVYIDARVGGSWRRIGGVAPRADGSFRRFIPLQYRSAALFRGILIGPSNRTEIAPDVLATARP
jgi:hypothetical protein